MHPFMMQELNLKPSNSLGQGWARARLFVSVAVDAAQCEAAQCQPERLTADTAKRVPTLEGRGHW